MAATMPVRVPGWPCAVPCQKPRPGQAWSTAMARKNAPRAVSSRRPSAASARTAPAARPARRPGSKGAPRPAPRTAPSARAPARRRTPRRKPRPPAPRPPRPARPAATRGRGTRRASRSRFRPGSRLRPYWPGPGGRTRPSGPVHQVAHPARRGCRRRCDDLARQSGRHRWLRLEDAVEDPRAKVSRSLRAAAS